MSTPQERRDPVLDSQPDIRGAGEAGDGRQALELLRTVAADVAVVDVRMPGLDGVEATRRIRASGDGPRVLILTTFDLDEPEGLTPCERKVLGLVARGMSNAELAGRSCRRR